MIYNGFAVDKRCALTRVKEAERISSLCGKAAIHHYAAGISSLVL